VGCPQKVNCLTKDAVAKTLKDFRPRLDERECKFLIWVLDKFREDVATLEQERRKTEGLYYSLQNELRIGATTPELWMLQAARRRLHQLNDMCLDWKDQIAYDMIKRLKGLLSETIIHPRSYPERLLNRLIFGSKNV
jgi:hypothetical protein